MRGSASISLASRKLSWGTRQVGIVRTAAGLTRLTALTIRRPDRASVQTDHNQLRISFRYPSQLIPTLVVFQELIEPELGALATMLGPGRIAIDVGASIGTWTMSAARTGAVVHAFEPDALNLEMLRENVLANDLGDHVKAYSLALGEYTGQGDLISAPRRYLNRVAKTSETSGGISVVTLDQFVSDQGIDQVDVLKVNTAGGERSVISGALGLFRAGRIRLAMVLDGLEVRPLLDDLRAHSYDIGVYDGTLKRFVSVAHSRDLDTARPSPMNHYVLVRRDDVIMS